MDKRLHPNKEKRKPPPPGREELEAEIRKDFHNLKNKNNGLRGSALRMALARKHSMPIAEINEITGQAERLALEKAKAEAVLEIVRQEKLRIEKLGQHAYQGVTPIGALPTPPGCIECGEPEMSKRHELIQKRLI